LFAITDAGRQVLAERDSSLPAPWEQLSDEFSQGRGELGKLMREVAFAFAQVMRTGSESQVAQSPGGLAQARKDLYRILADGEDAETSPGEDA